MPFRCMTSKTTLHHHQSCRPPLWMPSPGLQQRSLLLRNAKRMLLAIRLPAHLEIIVAQNPVAVLYCDQQT